MLLTTLVTLLLVAALGGAALASGFDLARTIFMPGSVVTATPPPAATAASTAVPPALTLSPSPLVLLQQDKHTCGATQIITNQTGDRRMELGAPGSGRLHLPSQPRTTSPLAE